MKKSILWFLGTLTASVLLSIVFLMLGLPIFVIFAFLPLFWMAPKLGEEEVIIEETERFKVPKRHPYKFCPVCGFKLEGWENYCPNCGFRLKK